MNPKRSILDERPVHLPVAGKIRTGVKVLKRSAVTPQTQAIYNNGLARGVGFDDIDAQIMRECGLDKSALVPKNTPYFRVSPSDFRIPELANRIIELYAEDLGDGNGRQLYRFPVVFAFDDWLQNMPHAMRTFGTSGLKFWSEYDAAGDRFCMTYAPKSLEPNNRRAARQFGGRAPMLRTENEGRCAPEHCREYQAKACSLSARLLFYVPGVPGSSLIEMDTGSIYSMRQIKSQFELIASIRNGRLSGTHAGQAIFWLTKVTDDIVRLDDRGEPVKARQHLVHLEARVDMVGVMAGQERAALEAPRAAAILGGPSPTAPTIEAEPVDPPPPAPAPDVDDRHAVKALRLKINELLIRDGTDAVEFSEKMIPIYGEGWSRKIETLRAILKTLEEC